MQSRKKKLFEQDIKKNIEIAIFFCAIEERIEKKKKKLIKHLISDRNAFYKIATLLFEYIWVWNQATQRV